MFFEIYNAGGLLGADWRWRLRAASNRFIIADSAEGYHNKADCEYALSLVKATNAMTPVLYL